MRLQTINETADEAADERREMLQQLKKLAKAAKKLAQEELQGLLDKPGHMANHALKGMTSGGTLLENDNWWSEMFQYWGHIKPEILGRIKDEIFSDVVKLVSDASNAGVNVVVEGGKTGAFLDILRSFASMFIMVFFPSVWYAEKEKENRRKDRGRGRGRDRDSGGRGRDRDSGGRGRDRDSGGRGENLQSPFAPSSTAPNKPPVIGNGNDKPPIIADLSALSSPSAEDEKFELKRLNPYIVFEFVDKCIKVATELRDSGEAEAFDNKPNDDLEDERPSSGETMDYPNIDEPAAPQDPDTPYELNSYDEL